MKRTLNSSTHSGGSDVNSSLSMCSSWRTLKGVPTPVSSSWSPPCKLEAKLVFLLSGSLAPASPFNAAEDDFRTRWLRT